MSNSTDKYYNDVTYCGNMSSLGMFGDTITNHPPIGRLCKKCKKKYIKEFGEEALFLELM